MELTKDKLIEKLYRTRLNPDEQIEKQPTVLSFVERAGTSSVNRGVFSLGDLSLIQGRQKTKKTFFTSSLITEIVGGNVYSKFHAEPHGKTAVVFDTEQSAYYAQRTNQRIRNNSGSDDFYYFAFRDSNPLERRKLIETFVTTYQKKICFALIDGIVDLLYDFNDLKECSELIQWIMKLTKDTNIHICCVLHENNSDGKARGHIGTMLAQKAETVIRIEKDKKTPEISVISANDTRGIGFNDFYIRIDINGNPQYESDPF